MTNDRPTNVPMAATRVELPYSEVCMSMRVAGQPMWVAPVGLNMAQLYDESGRKFSAPITRGEAGLPYLTREVSARAREIMTETGASEDEARDRATFEADHNLI